MTDDLSPGRLLTFGYQAIRTPEALGTLAASEGFTTVVDVRMSRYSGLRPWSLGVRSTIESVGLAYVWEKRLGNRNYKSGGPIVIDDIEAVETVLRLIRAGESVALMCACASPANCHRRVIADECRRRLPELQVVDLPTSSREPVKRRVPNMDRYPVAYLRRSSADEANPGDVSREVQEKAVRDLAERDGHNGELRVFTDWDRSADEAKEAKRAAFLSMLSAIEKGEVSTVYAYALDRLYRSMRTFVRLTDAAKARNVRIVTLREGVLGGDGSPMAQAFAQITAVFSELELNTAKARARSALNARVLRGDVLGQPGYGVRHVRQDGRIVAELDPDHPIGPILDAYREAGSVLAACRLLNERGIPAPKGGAIWGTSTLTRVLEANAPETLPRKTITGRRQPSHAALAQLVTCPHCHARLTPNLIRRQYYCRNGARDRSTHPRYVASEVALMAFAEAEAARLLVPDVALLMDGIEARRDALAERRARIADNYEVGLFDRPTRDAKLAAIAREMDELEGQAQVVEIPPSIDWHAAKGHPTELNAVLRVIWREIRLDPEMTPLDALWTRPEWRRGDDPTA